MIVDNGLPAVANFLDLDLETDKELWEVIELMADVCKTPIALITLLDEHRQYIKLRKGVDADMVLRPLSFCTHTLQHDDVLVVPDVLLDERFVNNPMVTGEPGVRF